MRVLVIIALSLLIVSCKTMKGDLEVHERITLLEEAGIFSSKRDKVSFDVGTHKAEFAITSKTGFTLSINVDGDESTDFDDDFDDDEYDFGNDSLPPSFVFKVPKGTKLPSVNGSLNFSAKQTRQPYAIQIEVSSLTNSYRQEEFKSCVTHYESETVCSWVPSSEQCTTTGGGEICRTRPDGQEVCHQGRERTSCSTTPGYESCSEVSVPVYGARDVTYEVTKTTKDVIATLKNNESKKATFKHVAVASSQREIGSGPCN